jgi:ABC-type antimicrobial peptide transport system permease subunit
MVVGQGARLAAPGIAIGLVAAVVVTRAVQSLVFRTEVLDPATYGGAALTVAIAALLASYIPARRAANVLPVTALVKPT